MAKAFFSFFIDVKPVLNNEELDKLYKTLENKIKRVNDLENKEDDIKLKKKQNKYLSFFSKLEKNASTFAIKMSAYTSILGGLAVLKFNNIKDFAEDLEQAKSASENVFNFLNASNKIAGVSQSNVLKDISELYASKRKQQQSGISDRVNLHLIGSSLNDDVDTILAKYKQTMSRLNNTEQQILTERLGLSKDTMRMARVSEKELKELSKLGFYSKNNIKKLQETAQATAELFGSAKDVKDRLIVSFSPVIISILSSIKGALESNSFSRILNSMSGLGEDIAKFNDTLKGIPFKALLGLLALEFAWKHKTVTAIMTVGTIIQDVVNGFKSSIFGFKAKKSVTGDVISNWKQIFSNEKQFEKINLQGREKIIANTETINRTTKNYADNSKVNNNTTINIEVKGNADRAVTRQIASDVRNIIDNNNSRFKNITDKK